MVDAPTDDERQALLLTAITRLVKMLTRRGVLIDEVGQPCLTEPDADGEDSRTLHPLQAAAITCRIAFGLLAGQKVLMRRGVMPRGTAARAPLFAETDGFRLQAAMPVEPYDRKSVEQLCRYTTRPALAYERVQTNAAGQVELKLSSRVPPQSDGSGRRGPAVAGYPLLAEIRH